MADTILILGNGFDLAMERKTRYSDFVEFANNLFLGKEDDLQSFLDSNHIDIEKYRAYNFASQFPMPGKNL